MRFSQLSRPLVVTAGGMAVLAVVCAIGVLVDDRTLVGVPIWLKPLKFSISIAIYSITVAWLLSLLPTYRRLGRWLAIVIAVTMYGEMVIIVGQVIRGRQSHFNVATPLDGTLYTIMGATIATAWIATAVIAILLMRQRVADRAAALAVRIGVLVALAGMGVGFLMTQPRAEQLRTPDGGAPTIVGAHGVGVTDGGPGLPLVNWSTTGGDLRVGHFVGMHALQAVPLLAFALLYLSNRYARLTDGRVRARLVLVGGLAYAALTVLVTWQALRGQSLVHPDALTAGAAIGVLLAVAAGTVWALRPVTPAPVPVPVSAEATP
jgi:hypothetical protein